MKQIDDDFRRVFSGEHGKRVLHHLMLTAGYFDTSFPQQDHVNFTHLAAWRDGRRSVVMDIISRSAAQVDPQDWNILQSVPPYNPTGELYNDSGSPISFPEQ